MSSLHRTASWVIVRLSDGEPVSETFSRDYVDALGRSSLFNKRYCVFPILDWLSALNWAIKLNGGTDAA